MGRTRQISWIRRRTISYLVYLGACPGLLWSWSQAWRAHIRFARSHYLWCLQLRIYDLSSQTLRRRRRRGELMKGQIKEFLFSPFGYHARQVGLFNFCKTAPFSRKTCHIVPEYYEYQCCSADYLHPRLIRQFGRVHSVGLHKSRELREGM
jgi:hypothetical protein